MLKERVTTKDKIIEQGMYQFTISNHSPNNRVHIHVINY